MEFIKSLEINQNYSRMVIQAAIALLLICFGLGLVFWIMSAYGTPAHVLTRDPMATVRAHPLTGVLSNFGIMIWCVTASVLFFTAISLRGIESPAVVRALWLPGILTTVLGIDDFFMVHEYLSGRHGIAQMALFSVYGLVALTYFLSSIQVILSRSSYPILGFAFLGFAASIYVDTIPPNWSSYHHLWEDGPKFAGIVFWSVYHVGFAFSLNRAAILVRDDKKEPSTIAETAVGINPNTES